jgi:hypothetical protein
VFPNLRRNTQVWEPLFKDPNSPDFKESKSTIHPQLFLPKLKTTHNKMELENGWYQKDGEIL